MPYAIPSPEIDGWMTPGELHWLYAQATRMQSVVEVGCWMGRSTHALCSGCRGRVFAVDHFRGSSAERHTNHRQALTEDIAARLRVNLAAFTNVSVVPGESVAVGLSFPLRSVEMVFLDAGHTLTEVLADLRVWGPVATRLLCGHDYGADGVAPAVDAYLMEKVLGRAPNRASRGEGSLWYVELAED